MSIPSFLIFTPLYSGWLRSPKKPVIIPLSVGQGNLPRFSLKLEDKETSSGAATYFESFFLEAAAAALARFISARITRSISFFNRSAIRFFSLSLLLNYFSRDFNVLTIDFFWSSSCFKFLTSSSLFLMKRDFSTFCVSSKAICRLKSVDRLLMALTCCFR